MAGQPILEDDSRQDCMVRNMIRSDMPAARLLLHGWLALPLHLRCATKVCSPKRPFHPFKQHLDGNRGHLIV